MKKYKLLQNLPDARAGIIFRPSEVDGGYCNCIDPLGHRPNVQPHYFYPKATVENTRDWFEEIK